MPSTTHATITNVSRRYFSKPWPVAPDSHLASFFRIAPNPPRVPADGPSSSGCDMISILRRG